MTWLPSSANIDSGSDWTTIRASAPMKVDAISAGAVDTHPSSFLGFMETTRANDLGKVGTNPFGSLSNDLRKLAHFCHSPRLGFFIEAFRVRYSHLLGRIRLRPTKPLIILCIAAVAAP